jgi:glycosyltransferase involved in cell wall biosynthesis
MDLSASSSDRNVTAAHHHKIAYLSQSAELGGAERSLLDCIAGVCAARPYWSVSLVVPSAGPLEREAQRLRIATRVLQLPPAVARLGDAGAGGPAGGGVRPAAVTARMVAAFPELVMHTRRLRREIESINPTIVHANGFKMQILGAWATPKSIPLVWHMHDYVNARPLVSHLVRMHAKWSAVAIANSNDVANDVRKVCRNRVTVHTVYNAVDLVRFAPNGDKIDLGQAAGQPPLAPQHVKVGLVATMARWKGHEVFLKAIARLPQKICPRAYVIGGPVYRTHASQFSMEELRSLADTLGIADRVCFTGFIEDSAAAMRSLDIVVHASTQPEPFGLVVAEAMALGKAIVASAVGGVKEIISEGVDVLSHTPGDAVSLADRIALLINRSDLRKWLGRAARQTAECRFSRQRLGLDLVACYERVAGTVI